MNDVVTCGVYFNDPYLVVRRVVCLDMFVRRGLPKCSLRKCFLGLSMNLSLGGARVRLVWYV